MKSTRSTRGSNGSRPSLRSHESYGGAPHRDSYSLSQPHGERPSVPAGDLRTEDSTSTGTTQLFPMETILSLSEHSLNMQLFRALGLVMSVKEAMWDELRERVGRAEEGRRLRTECGWEDADFVEGALREKFEGWVGRYQRCVCICVACCYLDVCVELLFFVLVTVISVHGCLCGIVWCSVGGSTRGRTPYRERRCSRRSGYGRTSSKHENTQERRT